VRTERAETGAKPVQSSRFFMSIHRQKHRTQFTRIQLLHARTVNIDIHRIASKAPSALRAAQTRPYER
jgi:hypothetical protein